jgi:phage regulator Rha-like protein
VNSFFVTTTYKDSTGKSNPLFVMTRDGFSLLVMGFTGKEALKFKIEYINAFNQMEDIIHNGIELRVKAVEENIKRRFLLASELCDVNFKIHELMKRHKEIKKELRQIDLQDFGQLILFPKCEPIQIKTEFIKKKKYIKL